MIGPKVQRIRVEGSTAADFAAASPAEVTVNPETGIATHRSAGTTQLAKDAEKLMETSPWVVSGRHKTRSDLVNEEARRIIDMAVKAKA
jgi:hypothetical protein